MEKDKRNHECVLLCEFHFPDIGSSGCGFLSQEHCVFDVLFDNVRFVGLFPSFVDVFDASDYIISIVHDLGIDKVKEVFGRVCFYRHLIVQLVEVFPGGFWRAEIASLAFGQQTEAIEQFECRGRRLMNRGND